MDKKFCRYGSSCRRKDCYFQHPSPYLNNGRSDSPHSFHNGSYGRRKQSYSSKSPRNTQFNSIPSSQPIPQSPKPSSWILPWLNSNSFRLDVVIDTLNKIGVDLEWEFNFSDAVKSLETKKEKAVTGFMNEVNELQKMLEAPIYGRQIEKKLKKRETCREKLRQMEKARVTF